MIDSHAHLTSKEISAQIELILNEFIDSGGRKILCVGHTPESNIEVLSLKEHLNETHSKVILPSLGIHPEYIQSLLSSDLDLYMQVKKVIAEYIDQVSKNIDKIHAIGECGLDYYHLKNNPAISISEMEEIKQLQRTIFKTHIELAQKYNLPLSIHVRDVMESNECIEDALKLLTLEGKGYVKGVFHSYTQNPAYIPEIIGLGFLIGVNGIITYPKADNIREMIKNIPISKLLLETDSPYLPPQRVRKDRKFWRSFAAPADVLEVAQTIAKVKMIETEKVIEETTTNFTNLFLID